MGISNKTWILGVLLCSFALTSTAFAQYLPYGNTPGPYGNPYEPMDQQPMEGQFGKIVRDQHFIYIYTPWKEMWNEAKREVVGHALDRVRSQLEIFSSNAAEAVDMIARSRTLDKILFETQPYLSLQGEPGMRVSALAPTGIMFMVGGKFSAGLKISGGGSVSLGAVMVPMVVHRISIEPQHVRLPDGRTDLRRTIARYVALDWALIGMPALNIGVGVGGGVGKRGGVGLIWGQLYDANDFYGPYLGLSQTIVKGIGVNLKAGIVFNNRVKKQFPFVMASAEAGPAVAAELHLNAALVTPLDEIFRMLGLPSSTAMGHDTRYYPSPYGRGYPGGGYNPYGGSPYGNYPGGGTPWNPNPNPGTPGGPQGPANPGTGPGVGPGPGADPTAIVDFKPLVEERLVINSKTVDIDPDQILKEVGCDLTRVDQCGTKIKDSDRRGRHPF